MLKENTQSLCHTHRRTSGAGGLCEALDVQGGGDVVLYGALVPPNNPTDGFSQSSQVKKHLQSRTHLGRVLEQTHTQGHARTHAYERDRLLF